MSSDKKRNIMPDAIGYIDDDIVSGTFGKINKKKGAVGNQRRRNMAFRAAVAVAIAACAAVLVLALPKTVMDVGFIDALRYASAGESGKQPESVEYDGSRGLLYEINANGTSASFIGFGNCTDETVYIASTYNGLPVTVMYDKDDKHVSYYESQLKHIKHIVISDTVKYVDSYFISECPNIESVYIGAGVEVIDSFYFLTGYGWYFSKIDVSPDNPYYSGNGNCVVDLRSKTLVIGTYKTVIPDDGSVEIIDIHAFDPARYWLNSIVIPEGVKIISFEAFGACEKLESIILPDSLEVIEPCVFSGCKALKKIEFGVGLKAIDVNIFKGINPPEVYYRGTVEQWEAVIKTSDLIVSKVVIIDGEGVITEINQDLSDTFTVICTDGESSSDAGAHADYYWRGFPEYQEYTNQEKANAILYDKVTSEKIYPWDKYVKE